MATAPTLSNTSGNKFSSVRKQVIKEAVIAGAVVVVLGIVAAMVGAWNESSQAAKVQAQSVLSATQTEVDINNLNLANLDKNLNLYEKIKTYRNNENFDLNRSALQVQLESLRQQYRLSELSLRMSPQSKIEVDAFKNSEMDVFVNQGTITFAGMTDQHLYSFIQDLKRTAPAFIKITRFSLTRNLNFDTTIMRQISNGQAVGMVSGEVAFDWIGFTTDTSKIKAAP